MIQPFHPVLPPPSMPTAPPAANPQWEAAKAKMAMLNLSEPEIIAALWRIPLHEREQLLDVMLGQLLRVGWVVPEHSQAPLQVPYLTLLSNSYASREKRAQLERQSFAASLGIAAAVTVAIVLGALSIWKVILS